MMRWIITKDHYGEGPQGTSLNAVGVQGPRDCDPKTPTPHCFKMYTDDNELVYEGKCSDVEFYPLDDFGMPNFGCTYIKYFVKTPNGYRWETL